MHLEKHAAKSPKERIDQYSEILGSALTKFLYFCIGKKPQSLKDKTIAEQMVEKWKNSENRMKELMRERNKYKMSEDKYIEQIEKLEASHAKLIANKKSL